MGLIEMASGASCWRGLDYYQSGKVMSCSPLGRGSFEGMVQGTDEEPYHVRIDIAHPRKSSCNCPHAKDRRIICKHQIALYFEAEPGAAEFFVQEQERLKREAERRLEEERKEEIRRITEHVKSLTAKEARKELIDALVREMEERNHNRWW